MVSRVADPAGQTRPRRRILLAQLTAPLRSFLVTDAGSAGMLLAAALFALVWANSPWLDAYESLWSTEAVVRVGGGELGMDLGHWVNDGLMALFFFVIGLEVRRELSIGEMSDRRRIVVPAVAALGGMVVPVLLYLLVNPSGEVWRPVRSLRKSATRRAASSGPTATPGITCSKSVLSWLAS
jgi:Na+/H+ antiporter NhaA